MLRDPAELSRRHWGGGCLSLDDVRDICWSDATDETAAQRGDFVSSEIRGRASSAVCPATVAGEGEIGLLRTIMS